MIALVVSLLLIVVAALLGIYTSIMTPTQSKFILVSSILYIILFGVILSILTSDKGIIEVFMDNSVYTPLIFYIFWYVTSATLVNLFTGNNDYQGFFENSNRYMSERNIMQR